MPDTRYPTPDTRELERQSLASTTDTMPQGLLALCSVLHGPASGGAQGLGLTGIDRARAEDRFGSTPSKSVMFSTAKLVH